MQAGLCRRRYQRETVYRGNEVYLYGTVSRARCIPSGVHKGQNIRWPVFVDCKSMSRNEIYVRLTIKGIKFEWVPECNSAVQHSITSLEHVVLDVPKSDVHYRLETDASDTGVGAVFYCQSEISETEWLPVLFLSSLDKHQRN